MTKPTTIKKKKEALKPKKTKKQKERKRSSDWRWLKDKEGKSPENRTKEGPGPERGPQVEQTALLASPIYIGQSWGQEEKQKEELKGWGGRLSLLFVSSGSACAHALRMYFLLFSKWNWAVTRSWNTDLSEGFNVHRFKFSLWWDRTKEITHSHNDKYSINQLFFFLISTRLRNFVIVICSTFS